MPRSLADDALGGRLDRNSPKLKGSPWAGAAWKPKLHAPSRNDGSKRLVSTSGSGDVSRAKAEGPGMVQDRVGMG